MFEYAPRELVRAGLRINLRGRRVCVFCFQKSRLVMSDKPAERMFFFTGADRTAHLGLSGGTKLAVPWPGEPLGTANATDNCVQGWSGVYYRQGRKSIMEIPV